LSNLRLIISCRPLSVKASSYTGNSTKFAKLGLKFTSEQTDPLGATMLLKKINSRIAADCRVMADDNKELPNRLVCLYS